MNGSFEAFFKVGVMLHCFPAEEGKALGVAEVLLLHELLHACPGGSQVLQRQGGGIGAVLPARVYDLAFCGVTKPGVGVEGTHVNSTHIFLFSTGCVLVAVCLG